MSTVEELKKLLEEKEDELKQKNEELEHKNQELIKKDEYIEKLETPIMSMQDKIVMVQGIAALEWELTKKIEGLNEERGKEAKKAQTIYKEGLEAIKNKKIVTRRTNRYEYYGRPDQEVTEKNIAVHEEKYTAVRESIKNKYQAKIDDLKSKHAEHVKILKQHQLVN